MIKVGIIGATGYTGAELVRILIRHREVKIVWYGSRSYVEQEFASIYRNFFRIVEDVCLDDNIEELIQEVDVIFTATPQGYCSSFLTEEILQKVKVIDLSADYRISDVGIYETWYKRTHESPQLIEEAVYGLSEINRDEIKEARLIANPGCYTTCSILSLYPLVREGIIDTTTLIIDAKSGTSGAGRGASIDNLYCEVNENMKAYAVAAHRHTPEIEEQLSIAAGEDLTISFTPHLVPMNRGIITTSYASLCETVTKEMIRSIYNKYYGNATFVRIMEEGKLPETRWVKGSNYIDIGFVIDARTNRIVVVACIDNLMKGAAGQAVQNMNLMFGFEETEGLELIPMFP